MVFFQGLAGEGGAAGATGPRVSPFVAVMTVLTSD